ncbi:O-antigen ligase family protein [Paenibacillus tarimensis]
MLTARTIVLGAGLSLLLCYSAYRYGLFFDVSLYRVAVYVCLASIGLLVGLAAFTFRNRKILSPLRSSMSYIITAGPFVISAAYGAHLLGQPVSVQGTMDQSLRWACYGAYLLVLTIAAEKDGSRRAINAALQITAAFVTAGSLVSWFGWSLVSKMIIYSGNEQITAVGARLAGFFQYPNMLGAVSAAFLVWNLLLMSRSASWHSYLVPAVMTVPLAVTLLLTESRGAWIAAVIGTVIATVLTEHKAKLPFWLFAGYTAAASAACYRFAVTAGAGDVTGAGLEWEKGALIIGAFALASFGALLVRFAVIHMRRFSGVACSVAVIAGSLLLAALLLPPSIQHRMEAGRYETAGARLLFYEDAVRLFTESPWLGRGGDSWRGQFERIQQQPYVGSEVHSGYLDMLLDLGLIGMVLFGTMLLLMMAGIWRGDRAVLAPVSLMLVHSAIDFDMSYGFFWLLLFTFAAVGLADWGRDPLRTELAAGDNRELPRRFRRTASLLAALLAAVWLAAAAWNGSRLEHSLEARIAASAAAGAAREAALRESLEANPHWTRIRLELAPLVPPQERAALLTAGLRDEPQSGPLHWELGKTYAELGEARRAAAFMRKALRLDRFSKAKQTEAVQLLAKLGMRLREAGRHREARLAAQAGLSIYETYEALDRDIRFMDRSVNDRKFTLTAEAIEAAESCRMLLEMLPR